MKKDPKFETEQEEREFWATHDSAEYIDPAKLQLVSFPNLKRSSDENAVVFSLELVQELQKLAKKKKVTWEKLVEQFTRDGLQRSSQQRRKAA